jgi:hypothetical protein
MADSKNGFLTKEIDIPKSLHELHGERTRVSTLLIVYLTALTAAAVSAWLLLRAGTPVWRTALAALIFMDVGGGVTANLSASTNRYYQDHPKLRLPFIAMHVFHPAVLAALFPAALPYFAYAALFTLGGTFAVNAVRDGELQQNLAALLVAVSCVFSFAFAVPVPVLYAFVPLFTVKLILGFAVRRQFPTA